MRVMGREHRPGRSGVLVSVMRDAGKLLHILVLLHVVRVDINSEDVTIGPHRVQEDWRRHWISGHHSEVRCQGDALPIWTEDWMVHVPGEIIPAPDYPHHRAVDCIYQVNNEVPWV